MPYRPADITPPFSDESYDVVPRCFLAEAGAANGEPCWGRYAVVFVPPDESGAPPGSLLLCEGHLPVYSAQPYQPKPDA